MRVNCKNLYFYPKVNVGDVEIEIGAELSPIPLQCDYSRYFTISQDFESAKTEVTQNGATRNFRRTNGLFNHVFFMNINEFDDRIQNFRRTDGVMVGQRMQVRNW